MIKQSTSVICDGADVAPSISVGHFVVVHPGAFIESNVRIEGLTQVWSGIKIGIDTRIGSSVTFQEPAHNGGSSNIFIGKSCLIGAGSIIHSGVTIGDGAIVRPGAVVEGSVPAYAIVAGIPAHVVDYVKNPIQASTPVLYQQADFPATPSNSLVGVGNVTLHRFKRICDLRGDLTVGEFCRDIPFEPKRYFLVFNVPSEKLRGEHAHLACHQFLVCVKGSCSVVVDDGTNRCEVRLDSPDTGMHLPPLTWGIQYKYSEDAVLLVFTSDYYDADDYIRDYDEFQKILSEKSRKSD